MKGITRDALLRFVRLAVEVARKRIRTYASKFAPKRYTQPALLPACVLKST